jgi:tetratricopeptide (TPR) repeat protein
MKKYLIVFAVLLLSLKLMADNDTDMVLKGNNAYKAGMFSQAITCYQSVLKRGVASAELYYNLGNACFKSNDIPSAILYYEKAKALRPNDENIDFNLKIANSKITDKIEQVPQLFIKRWWTSLFNLLSLDVLAMFCIASFTLFFVLLSVFLFAGRLWVRKIAFWSGVGFLVLSMCSFGIAQRKHHALAAQQEAIVFTPAVTVKSSPDENSVDLFMVHEGAKVTILDTLGNWQEIRIGNGSEGWIKAVDTRRI